MSISHLVRPNILVLEPYTCARDEFSGTASAWLDANENSRIDGRNRYPDPLQMPVKQRIAALRGVDPRRIFLGVGSDECIDILYRVFCRPGVDNVVAIAPTYGMYGVCAAINDVEYRQVLLRPDFSLDADALLAATDANTKLLWICSPNNPTANAFPADQIEEIARRFDGITVVDEAYIDFSSQPSMLPRLASMERVVVMQTLSKAWASAAIRLGIAYASEEIIGIFNRVKYPYNISQPTAEAALRILGQAPRIARVASELNASRAVLAEELAKLPTVERVYPSDANFLLVKVADADALYRYLLDCGVVVRNRSRVPLCQGCLRVTVGTPFENRLLLEAMRRFGGDAESVVAPEGQPSSRRAVVRRSTAETSIAVAIDLDGRGDVNVDTGLKFFDHMLQQIGRHGGFDLDIEAHGDLEVDEHHTIEDTAIVLGQTIRQALGDKRGIERYGFTLPMDDCLCTVALDLGGRPWLQWDAAFARERIGDVPTEMFLHFFKSLSDNAQINLAVQARGDNEHHKIEGIFKAFARALRQAARRDTTDTTLPSSKGSL